MRIALIASLCLTFTTTTLAAEPEPEGPFQGSWDSLSKYQCPEWFRDAKFGIWAHWDAQCVPEMGDWYARKMYINDDPKNPGQPDADYTDHLNRYGHPSEVGFKDIDNIWHAENWDPEKLIALYKRAGAQYFVALANHHDNFDCYDSKYQPWNSLNIGPHKDIVGGWEKAARKSGLRFGVSVHCSHAWDWYEVAQGSDKSGPYAGVSYDGKLTKADGKGKWWEGYDPQDLYAQNHVPGKDLVWTWDIKKGSSIPDQTYMDKFYNRTADLMDKYKPDFIYYDDTILPFYTINDMGLKLVARQYNASMQWHAGQNEAVITGKHLSDDQSKCITKDMERTLSSKIQPRPYETDTCIGEWHYKKDVKYKSAKTVVQMLCDVVSKNGNLLLSIPVRGDGTLDDRELAVIADLTKWMDVNSSAIIGTRPFTIYGEASAVATSKPTTRQSSREGTQPPLTAADIRFTTKGDTLFAIAMAPPTDGKLIIRSLASGSENYPEEIGEVEILGATEKPQVSRDENGLTVQLPPGERADMPIVVKIDPK